MTTNEGSPTACNNAHIAWRGAVSSILSVSLCSFITWDRSQLVGLGIPLRSIAKSSYARHDNMRQRWQQLHFQKMTRQTVNELDKFLTDNKYYDSEEFEKVNGLIIDSWDNRLQESLIGDLKEKIKGIEIQKTRSLFDLVSDEQGATLYKSFFDLRDKNEKIEIVIKLIVNHDKGVIYLGSRHADKENYEGESKTLGLVYNELKKADKQFGFFRPVDFYRLKIE